MHHFAQLSFGFPAAGGCHVFAHGVKLEYIRLHFVQPHHTPPAGDLGYHMSTTKVKAFVYACFSYCDCKGWFRVSRSFHSLVSVTLDIFISAESSLSKSQCNSVKWAFSSSCKLSPHRHVEFISHLLGRLLSADKQLTDHTVEWLVCNFMWTHHTSKLYFMFSPAAHTMSHRCNVTKQNDHTDQQWVDTSPDNKTHCFLFPI